MTATRPDESVSNSGPDAALRLLVESVNDLPSAPRRVPARVQAVAVLGVEPGDGGAALLVAGGGRAGGPGVAVRDAQLALAALAALTGPARHGAARALAEAYLHDDVAQILNEWLDDRPGDT